MGWNGNNGASKPSPRKNSRLPLVQAAIGLAAILAAYSAWRFFLSADASTDNGNDAEEIVAESNANRPCDTRRSTAKQDGTTKSPAESVAVVQDEWNMCPLYPNEKLLTSVTNRSTGYIVDNTLMKNGKKAQHVRELPSIWETTTDGMIAGLLAGNAKHADLPPLPPMSTLAADREFIKSLETPIEILKDDTEEVKAIKMIVRAARKDIKKRMDAGEHFKDILSEHHAILNDNGVIRKDAIDGLLEVRRNGSADDVNVYVTAVNQQLEKLGISPIGTSGERHLTEEK